MNTVVSLPRPVPKHLGQLLRAGVLKRRQDGRSVWDLRWVAMAE